jgi:hypothetical protein
MENPPELLRPRAMVAVQTSFLKPLVELKINFLLKSVGPKS